MADELDDPPLADEAKLECASKTVRRGIAALRGTRSCFSANGYSPFMQFLTRI